MPLFDMPLEEMRRYQGVNPAPFDHEEFWDKGIKETEALDPKAELKPALFKAPGAECFDLYFTGVGNARIYAKYLRPKNRSGRCPAALCFHGYSGDSGDWHEKLDYVSAGFCVAIMDCRGQGGKSEDPGGVKGTTLSGHIIRGLEGPPEKMIYRNIYLDCLQLSRVVMGFPEVDPERLAALGGSQGGGLTLACAALSPKIKKAAPEYPFLCDFQRVYSLEYPETPYHEVREYFIHQDPTHEREKAIFTQLGYIDVQHLARRIRAEVLMGTALLDKVCPPSSQFAAYNRLRSKKDMVIYPDLGHEWLPGYWDKVYEMMMSL